MMSFKMRGVMHGKHLREVFETSGLSDKTRRTQAKLQNNHNHWDYKHKMFFT